MRAILNFITILLCSSLLSFKSTNNDPKNLTKQEILEISYKNCIKYNWFKTKKYIANDEYDNWLVCEYFYSKSEKIIVTYADLKGVYPDYIETKLNIFQDDVKLRNGYSFKNVTLNKYTYFESDDNGDFVITEFDTKNKSKYIHLYKLSCSRKLEANNHITISQKVKAKKVKELPAEIQNCKLLSCKIFKNFDAKGNLFKEPLIGK